MAARGYVLQQLDQVTFEAGQSCSCDMPAYQLLLEQNLSLAVSCQVLSICSAPAHCL